MIEFFLLLGLTQSTALNNLATQRAEIVYQDWSHNNWKESFKNTPCSYKGENLAKDFNNDTDILKAWMNSKSHKENIMNKNYNYYGLGSYKNVRVLLLCGIIK